MRRVYISQNTFTEIVLYKQWAKEMTEVRKNSWNLLHNDKQPSDDAENQTLDEPKCSRKGKNS
jgi:hypothetical protein